MCGHVLTDRLVRLLCALVLSLGVLGACAPVRAGEEPLSRVLSGALSLSPTPRPVTLDPPLQPMRRVQYVALEVPDAPRWRRGSPRGLVVDPDGRPVRIQVVLERADGLRVVLDEPSFGRSLLFSHLPLARNADGSDLPHGDRYVRLWLSADPGLELQGVRWSDLTNP